MRVALAMAAVAMLASVAHADDLDPRRKVVVLEYRASSSALPGIASVLVGEMTNQTSLQLLGPDQTRTIYGDGLDQAVVKCAGEAECVAKIGAKVGAKEVVLVGVSEVGDVILTMQRIDVAKRTVTARLAELVTAEQTPTNEQISSYLQRLLPPGDFKRFGVIEIRSSETGAVVSIGGEKRGVTPIEPLKLPAPAAYAIRVEKEGFVPFTTKVQLPPSSELTVDAELSRRGATAHWYTKWYVLAGIGVVSAGLVGGGIYFATREPATSVGVNGMVSPP
ncbi:MAG TPA: PEGA domain-containing protein [Kofleriaceae bacterium]|nr:PEGA domain-containing protein [Kofleriaceae bacterium]